MCEEVAKEALERCVKIEDEDMATFDYSYIHWSKDKHRLGVLMLDVRLGVLMLDVGLGVLMLDVRLGVLMLDVRLGILMLDVRLGVLMLDVSLSTALMSLWGQLILSCAVLRRNLVLSPSSVSHTAMKRITLPWPTLWS